MVDENYIKKLQTDKMIFLAIILLLSLTLGYVVMQGNKINDSCNKHWESYMDNCVCSANTRPMNNLNISIGDFNAKG